MKILINSEAPVTFGTACKEIEFKAELSAKAFKILSDTLYSDKISSIIRELSSNAYDSHVMANKAEVPFDVHLPSKLEPYFSIRDYGVSLSHKDIKKIYTSYFTSTKSDSNDVVGAFGLGSKTPFCYTNQFTVTAIMRGVKRVYTSFIDEMGIPKLSLLFRSKTDEPEGMEVSFAISEDFPSWHNKARSIYNWYKVKPKTNLTLNTEDPFDNAIKLSDDIYLYKLYSNYPKVVFGNNAYFVERAPRQLTGRLSGLFDKVIALTDIGKLEVTASRESLSYTDATKDELEKIQTKFSELITDAIDTPEKFSKFILDNKLSHRDSVYSQLMDFHKSLLINEYGRQLLDPITAVIADAPIGSEIRFVAAQGGQHRRYYTRKESGVLRYFFRIKSSELDTFANLVTRYGYTYYITKPLQKIIDEEKGIEPKKTNKTKPASNGKLVCKHTATITKKVYDTSNNQPHIVLTKDVLNYERETIRELLQHKFIDLPLVSVDNDIYRTAVTSPGAVSYVDFLTAKLSKPNIYKYLVLRDMYYHGSSGLLSDYSKVIHGIIEHTNTFSEYFQNKQLVADLNKIRDFMRSTVRDEYEKSRNSTQAFICSLANNYRYKLVAHTGYETAMNDILEPIQGILKKLLSEHHDLTIVMVGGPAAPCIGKIKTHLDIN